MNRTVYAKVAGIISSVVALNFVWLNYVRREATIYSWDHDNFWEMCWNYQQYLRTDPVGRFFRWGLSTIRHSDYTAEPIWPIAILISLGERLHLFGYSRASYVLCNGNLYLVPALLLLVWLISGLRRTKVAFSFRAITATEWLAGALVALLTPTLWLPLYRGYPDGGGLIFCFLTTALFFRWRDSSRSASEDLQTWLPIVILLVGLTFFRRWYLYWIVWFWVAAAVVCLWDALEERRRGSRCSTVFGEMGQLFGAASAYGLLVYAVSPDFVKRVLTYDYADRYSAFQDAQSFGEHLVAPFSALGVVGILLFVGGLAYALREPRLRMVGVFLSIQLAGIVLQFSRTQHFGAHHRYLLLAAMLPLTTLFVVELLRRFRWGAAAGLVPIGLLAYTLSFTSSLQNVPHFLLPLAGAVDGAPLSRGDLAEWRRLTATLDELMRSQGEGRVYVLASSETINSSAFISVNRSLNEAFITPKFVDLSREIDKRDGFPAGLLHAKYVIVAVPIQVDFNPRDQQVIVIPARELLDGTGVGGAFDRQSDRFLLDGGVNVYIYSKVRPFRPEEVQQLSAELRNAYPDRPYVYEPSNDDR